MFYTPKVTEDSIDEGFITRIKSKYNYIFYGKADIDRVTKNLAKHYDKVSEIRVKVDDWRDTLKKEIGVDIYNGSQCTNYLRNKELNYYSDDYDSGFYMTPDSLLLRNPVKENANVEDVKNVEGASKIIVGIERKDWEKNCMVTLHTKRLKIESKFWSSIPTYFNSMENIRKNIETQKDQIYSIYEDSNNYSVLLFLIQYYDKLESCFYDIGIGYKYAIEDWFDIYKYYKK